MKVFISYARPDTEFVDRLSGGLTRHGFEVIIDRKDIAALDDWKHQLERMIRKADGAVFVISPEWLASTMCSWELERFTKFSKRLAPILLRKATTPLPPKLAAIQYVDFTDAGALEAQTTALATALNSDADWSRAHTTYLDLAERWLDLKRPDDHCLKSHELRDARVWLRRRPAVGAAPTPLQREFIDRSAYVNSWTHKALQSVTLATVKAGDKIAVDIGWYFEQLFKLLFRILLFILWCAIRAGIYVIGLLRLRYWRWLPIIAGVALVVYIEQDEIAALPSAAVNAVWPQKDEAKAFAAQIPRYPVGKVVSAKTLRTLPDGVLLELDGGATGFLPRADGQATGADDATLSVQIAGVDNALLRFNVVLAPRP